MDVRTLRAFVAVFEERNITAAATRLFITQPTLSTTIKTLEDELGVTLFVRQARGVEGTEAAHRLYPRAKRLIADTDSLAREFRETSPCLELTVGIEADLGDGVVGTLVNGVLAHEEILLTLEEGCCGDVRLGCESLRCGDELFIPLLEEEFVLVLPPDHPLTGKGSLTPDALADEQQIGVQGIDIQGVDMHAVVHGGVLDGLRGRGPHERAVRHQSQAAPTSRCNKVYECSITKARTRSSATSIARRGIRSANADAIGATVT